MNASKHIFYLLILVLALGLVIAFILLVIKLMFKIKNQISNAAYAGNNKKYKEDKKKILQESIKNSKRFNNPLAEEQNFENIVDVAKPLGFWTKYLMSQKMLYLLEIRKIIKEAESEGKKIGYWQIISRGVKGKNRDQRLK